jgi:hypothetical protein
METRVTHVEQLEFHRFMTSRDSAEVDTLHMRVRSGRSNLIMVAMMLPALVAALPTIQVCRLRSAERDAFFRCLLFGPSVAAASAGQSCGATESAACEARSCPRMEQCGTSCPLAPARPATYCIGDPAGPGLRSSAPQIPTLDRIVAAVLDPALIAPPPPMPAQAALPELQARPPTRAPEAPPPIRAPPSVA